MKHTTLFNVNVIQKGIWVYNGMNVKMKNAPELWNLRGCKVVV